LNDGGYFSNEADFDNNNLIYNGVNNIFASKLNDVSTANKEIGLNDLNVEFFPNPSGDCINISIDLILK